MSTLDIILRAKADVTDFVQNEHRTALKILICYDGRLFCGVGFADCGGEQGKTLALETAIQDQAAQIRRYQAANGR